MPSPAPVRLTAPPSRLAVRHTSGFCIVDHDVLDAARRLDERDHAAQMRGWVYRPAAVAVPRG